MNHLRPKRSASGPNDSAPIAAPTRPGGADLSELRHRQMDHPGDRRRGIADRLGVEAVERRDQHAEDKDADLKARDRMPVDKIDDVDFGHYLGHGHGFPPNLPGLHGRAIVSIFRQFAYGEPGISASVGSKSGAPGGMSLSARADRVSVPAEFLRTAPKMALCVHSFSTNPTRWPGLRRVQQSISVRSDDPARRHRAVARRQNGVHHRADPCAHARWALVPRSSRRSPPAASPARSSCRNPTTPCARFDYEGHVDALVNKRNWPDLDAANQRIARRDRIPIAGQRPYENRLTLDIVDYPGEWLLDLPLFGEEL